MESAPFLPSSTHCCSCRPPAPRFGVALHLAFGRVLLLQEKKTRALRRSSLQLISGAKGCRSVIVCSNGGPDDTSSPPKISAAAKIRGEVIAPFRTVRIFFYLAFIASGSVGALTSLPRLIAALGHAPNAAPASEVLVGLAIDLAAILVFAFLYRGDIKAREAQLAKLSREETLAMLKIELKNKKVLTLGQLRGVVRLVLVVGPAAHIEEACRASEAYSLDLVERGVMAVYFATDGQVPSLKFSTNDDESSTRVNRLWRGTPIYTAEWTRWLKEQKQLAKVPEESPVYLSLRLDGRVRGSGTGLPPWPAFVAQLPPMKGMWSGVLDGMDGRI